MQLYTIYRNGGDDDVLLSRRHKTVTPEFHHTALQELIFINILNNNKNIEWRRRKVHVDVILLRLNDVKY